MQKIKCGIYIFFSWQTLSLLRLPTRINNLIYIVFFMVVLVTFLIELVSYCLDDLQSFVLFISKYWFFYGCNFVVTSLI